MSDARDHTLSPAVDEQAEGHTLLITGTQSGSAEVGMLSAVHDALAERGDVQRADPVSFSDLEAALMSFPHDLLVVAGGDGTLHLVLTALYHRDMLDRTPVALVPVGTDNDFAQSTGLSLDPIEAAQVAISGTERPTDVIIDTETRDVTVNAVHMGVGESTAAAAPIQATLTHLRPEGARLEVIVDGRRVTAAGPAAFAAVCNGSVVGDGALMVPPADPFDGQLDVVVINAPEDDDEAARLTEAASDGSLLDLPNVAHHRGREVSIAGEPAGEMVDGEAFDERPQRRYQVLPGSLRLAMLDASE